MQGNESLQTKPPLQIASVLSRSGTFIPILSGLESLINISSGIGGSCNRAGGGGTWQRSSLAGEGGSRSIRPANGYALTWREEREWEWLIPRRGEARCDRISSCEGGTAREASLACEVVSSLVGQGRVGEEAAVVRFWRAWWVLVENRLADLPLAHCGRGRGLR